MSESTRGPERIVVVGAGECGTRAAMALRERGFTGAITLLGREDVIAYERPPLSKAALAADDAELVHPWTAEALAEAGVALRLGVDVTGIDREARTVETTDGPVPYDRLLLATGAGPRRLGLDHVHYLRTHSDAATLRDLVSRGGRLLVIGAGFIGLEIAAGARERGMEVVVVEAAERALARMVPPVVAERVVALHAAHGVEVRTGTTVTAVERHVGGLRASLSTGESLDVDAVVAGVGAAPHTEIAAAAGLVVDDGIVDCMLQVAVTAVKQRQSWSVVERAADLGQTAPIILISQVVDQGLRGELGRIEHLVPLGQRLPHHGAVERGEVVVIEGVVLNDAFPVGVGLSQKHRVLIGPLQSLFQLFLRSR